VAPDLPLHLAAADYFAGHDTLFEHVLSHACHMPC
jgi:hypothetical protein